MKTRFRELQDQIGCRGNWLAKTLGISEPHISRLRHGKETMTRLTEVAMMALASGWRPEKGMEE